MTCTACKKRELKQPWQEWAGSEPKCAFPNGGQFTSNNWNCATANLIRDLCGDYDDDDRHPAVDWRAHNALCDSPDRKYATIELPECVELEQRGDDIWPVALWVTWHKRRGRTEGMWLLMDEGGEPHRPTEADCVTIIETLVEVEGRWRKMNAEFAARTLIQDAHSKDG